MSKSDLSEGQDVVASLKITQSLKNYTPKANLILLYFDKKK